MMNKSDISSWRVLTVDDEPDSIEVVTMVLRASGATVFEANDGKQAFEVYKKEKPNLVLSDLSMPEMDGWQLLQEIRGTEGGNKIPVIALTAHAMIGDKERVLAAGFTSYMSKPLRMITFMKDLMEALDRQPDPQET